jgi:hypothetical protein
MRNETDDVSRLAAVSIWAHIDTGRYETGSFRHRRYRCRYIGRYVSLLLILVEKYRKHNYPRQKLYSFQINRRKQMMAGDLRVISALLNLSGFFWDLSTGIPDIARPHFDTDGIDGIDERFDIVDKISIPRQAYFQLGLI